MAEVCGCGNVAHSGPWLCRSFTDKEPLCGRIIAERANVYNRSSIGSERRRDEETHLSNQRGIGGWRHKSCYGAHTAPPCADRVGGADALRRQKNRRGPFTDRVQPKNTAA